jgi:hypothetical protein
VIIDDLNFVRIAVAPFETDPVLIVYANAVLVRSRTLQRLKPVSRRHP